MKAKFKATAKYSGIVLASMIFGAAVSEEEPQTVTKTVTEKVTDNAAVEKLEKELDRIAAERDELAEKLGGLEAEAAEAKEKEKQEKEKAAAKPTTLGTGQFVVGEDIAPGRYVVTTQERGGNFFVFDNNGWPIVNEMLGTDTEFYVNNLTIELEEGFEIEISGLNAVSFKAK